MSERKLHDGREDGLTPLRSIDLDGIRSFSEMLHAMSLSAFSGRQLGRAAEILTHMFQDSDAGVVMTISGAMTVAKQGKIICDLIDRGCVQAIIATGALIAHGLSESIGLAHYRCEHGQDDRDLFNKGYNRIYDTLEMESNLNDVSQVVGHVLRQEAPPDGVWSSARLCRAIGKHLSHSGQGIGILRSAFEKNVPVFIPAFTDSELGLDVATSAISQSLQAMSEEERRQVSIEEIYQEVPAFNPFHDLYEYTRLITGFDHLGIFTIGGGVPRNWAQQVGPFVDITNLRTGTSLEPPRFKFGVRVCPEPVHWGGLSGCTYSEGVSWGKFIAPEDGGQFAEVYSDATVVLPLLVKGVLERLQAENT